MLIDVVINAKSNNTAYITVITTKFGCFVCIFPLSRKVQNNFSTEAVSVGDGPQLVQCVNQLRSKCFSTAQGC